jgi:signal transduction histidine kinase
MIGLVDIAFSGWSLAGALRRLVLIFLLLLVIMLIARVPKTLLRHYTLGFGLLVGVVYVCSVTVTHLFRIDEATAVVNPTALLGLWMLYGFVRLPIHVSLAIGVIGGIFALFGSRMTNLPDPAIRTFVYLVIGNALGLTLARSIELRERQLFQQKETLRDAQLELQRRSDIAEQAAASKTRLVAAVGHDLRQPMMAARLHLSVLIQKMNAGDGLGAERQAAHVQQAVQLLNDLLEHLLLAARYDAGTEQINIGPVSLREIFHRVEQLCALEAQEQGVALIMRMPRPKVYVLTDNRICLRALVNLVTNAVKFAKPPHEEHLARVVVRAAVVGSRCKIGVLDNGIGISDHDIDAIWEPFFQVGNEERNRARGVGLGLYLVKQSIRAMEGHRISVKSKVGSGTYFEIEMPFVAMALPTPAHPGSDMALPVPNLHDMHVVLIEDDQGAREALQAQLESWGVSYFSGSSFEEILPFIMSAEGKIEAILADLRLPGPLDGVATIESIRDRLGYLVDAVVITGEVDQELVLSRLPEKCSLIRKPFDSFDLYRTLEGFRAL